LGSPQCSPVCVRWRITRTWGGGPRQTQTVPTDLGGGGHYGGGGGGGDGGGGDVYAAGGVAD